MKKKFYIALITVFAVLILSVSYSFANNTTGGSAVQGIRNAVGGAENAIENVGNGIAGGIKTVTGAGENTMGNVTNSNRNTTTNNKAVAGTSSTRTDNGNYASTRTATRAATPTTGGITSTMFTWIIMAIVGIVIVALVWMYAKQNNTYSKHDNNY